MSEGLELAKPSTEFVFGVFEGEAHLLNLFKTEAQALQSIALTYSKLKGVSTEKRAVSPACWEVIVTQENGGTDYYFVRIVEILNHVEHL